MKAILCIVIQFFLSEQTLAGTKQLQLSAVRDAAHTSSRFHIDSVRIPITGFPAPDYFRGTSSVNSHSDRKKKSGFLALSLSAVIPGTGQLYAQKGRESMIKGVAFLAFEATGLILYFHNRNQGKKIERKYERFADQNWDVDRYLDYLETALESDPDIELSAGNLGRKDTGINYALLEAAENEWGRNTGVHVHHLYKNSRQQYYEMIYKYPEQFALGWADALYNPSLDSPTGYTRRNLTPLMIDYRGMRIESNDYLSTARSMSGLILINHFLSLGDAAWTVKRKNKEELGRMSMSVRLEQKLHYNQLVTMPTLRLTY